MLHCVVCSSNLCLTMEENSIETKLLFDEVKEDAPENTSQHILKPDSRKVKAIGFACAFFSMFLHAVSTGFAQALGGYIPDFQLNFWRFTAQFVTVAPVILFKSWDVRPQWKHVPWMVVVGGAYNIANYTYYGSSAHIPAGTLGGLVPSLVIVFTSAVTLAITKECKLHVTVSAILCLAGVILLTQPEFIFNDVMSGSQSARVFRYHPLCSRLQCDNDTINLAISDSFQSNQTTTFQGSELCEGPVLQRPKSGDVKGYIFLTIAAVALTTGYFVPHRFLLNVNPCITLFWVSSGGVVVSSIAMSSFQKMAFPQSATCMLFLLGHATSSAVGTLCTQVSVQAISPLVFSLVSSLQVIVLYAAQYTFLRHLSPGNRNAVEVVGVVIVFLGNIAGPVYELYRDVWRKPQATPAGFDFTEVDEE